MINVEKLTKSFGPKLSVDHITFTVSKGEVLGFLGPNGAGKSTSMRMITGYLPPTEGTVTIGGFDISENPLEAKRRIGYLPENAPIYSDMSVAGFLSFCAEMRGLYGAAKAEAIDRVVEMCFLNRVMQQSVDTLSKGFRHRTCLAQALIHDPEVLILDEPTDGLDPNQKHEVRSLLRRLGTDKAIIFSTHILEEVEAACTRALIIDQGSIVAIGTPEELKAQAPSAGIIILTVTGAEQQSLVSQLQSLPSISQCELLSAADGGIAVRLIPKGQALPELIALAGRSSWKVENIQIDEGRLDDVFRSITLPDTKTAA
ncbi:MAG TPA: ATP-binding cassette domain-containing protein [Chthoniobacterales bacterium]|nr:ATP-binding cassette domain-containing protein [Chthoniobacterales bacterium]